MLTLIVGLLIGVLLTLAYINRDAIAVRYYNDRADRAGKRANAALATGDSHEKARQLGLKAKYQVKAAEAAERANPSPKPIS